MRRVSPALSVRRPLLQSACHNSFASDPDLPQFHCTSGLAATRVREQLQNAVRALTTLGSAPEHVQQILMMLRCRGMCMLKQPPYSPP